VDDRERLSVVAATATRQAQQKYREMKLELETLAELTATQERDLKQQLSVAKETITMERETTAKLVDENKDETSRLCEYVNKVNGEKEAMQKTIDGNREAMESFELLEFEVRRLNATVKELKAKNEDLQNELFETRLAGGGLGGRVDDDSEHGSMAFSETGSVTPSFMNLILAEDGPKSPHSGAGGDRAGGGDSTDQPPLFEDNLRLTRNSQDLGGFDMVDDGGIGAMGGLLGGRNGGLGDGPGVSRLLDVTAEGDESRRSTFDGPQPAEEPGTGRDTTHRPG
jgi:hypothetical protein